MSDRHGDCDSCGRFGPLKDKKTPHGEGSFCPGCLHEFVHKCLTAWSEAYAELHDDLATNAALLAKQTDLARDAEVALAAAEKRSAALEGALREAIAFVAYPTCDERGGEIERMANADAHAAGDDLLARIDALLSGQEPEGEGRKEAGDE